MARNNLPDEIIRILSFHGPVELWTGSGERARTGKVELAPFDEELILLVPVGSPLADGLLQTCEAHVSAKKEDKSYSLRLRGRASAGRPVSAHPQRSAIQPWLSEGARPERLLAVPFVALEVELVKEQGIEKTRFAGPTPAGMKAPGALRRWIAVSLGEHGRWAALSGMVCSFLWFGYLGADYPFRGLAVALAWLAVLGLVGGIRLLGLSAAFRLWLRGKGDATRLGALRAGQLAPDQARMGGLLALVAALACLVGLAAFPQGGASVLVVLLSAGSPILAASWAMHALVSSHGDGEG